MGNDKKVFAAKVSLLLLIALPLVLIGIQKTHAQNMTINFDDASQGVFDGEIYTSRGAIFRTTGARLSVFKDEKIPSGNFLGAEGSNCDNHYCSPIEILFVVPNSNTTALTDALSLDVADFSSETSGSWKVEIFDKSGNLLDTSSGSESNVRVSFHRPRRDIRSVRFTPSPDNDGIDNLSFNTPQEERFTISGRVSMSDGTPLQGVSVSIRGSRNSETRTNRAGMYEFRSLLASGSYTVTPSLEGTNFTPAAQQFNGLPGDMTSANFIASFLIAGRVSLQSGEGVSGVTVNLSDGRSMQTAADGSYRFLDIQLRRRYVITPTSSDHGFEPYERFVYTIDHGVTEVNFIAIRNTVKASFSPTLPPSAQPSVLSREGYNISRPRRLPIKVTVKVDTTGSVSPSDYKVRLRIRSENGASGHKHVDSQRPHGWVFLDWDQILNMPLPLPQYAIGGVRDSAGPIQSVKSGEAVFYYLPPETSGVEFLNVELVSNISANAISTLPPEHKIDIRIDGLQMMQLPAPPFTGPAPRPLECVEESGTAAVNLPLYDLVGAGDPSHFRFAVRPDVYDKIMSLARNYIDLQLADCNLQMDIRRLERVRDPQGQPLFQFADTWTLGPADIDRANRTAPVFRTDILRLNDISLPWGGLFDVENDFSPSHGGHRWGDQVDIKTTHLMVDFCSGVAQGTSDRRLRPFVERIHRRQFQLLREAINQSGGRIVREGNCNHLHVVF